MSSLERYRLHGGMGSPYSMKLRAVLRYRRIPHDWVLITRDSPVRQLHQGPNVIPVLQFPDGTARVDSTPLIFELERRESARSVLPDDPATAFYAMLIEDMADEWLTKLMFHYRWYRDVDQQFSARQIIADNAPGLVGAAFEAAAQTIRERQVGRMALVGCTPGNAPLIEETYFRVLDLLQSIAVRDRYLFGTRPALADFAVFGQFRVLSEDHTPHVVMRQRNPRVYDWIRRLDDASGVEGEWHPPHDLNAAALGMLQIVGECYLPFLLANARALSLGRGEFTLTLRNKPFTQGTFRYQAKCLDMLRAAFHALPANASEQVRATMKLFGGLEALERRHGQRN